MKAAFPQKPNCIEIPEAISCYLYYRPGISIANVVINIEEGVSLSPQWLNFIQSLSKQELYLTQEEKEMFKALLASAPSSEINRPLNIEPYLKKEVITVNILESKNSFAKNFARNEGSNCSWQFFVNKTCDKSFKSAIKKHLRRKYLKQCIVREQSTSRMITFIPYAHDGIKIFSDKLLLKDIEYIGVNNSATYYNSNEVLCLYNAHSLILAAESLNLDDTSNQNDYIYVVSEKAALPKKTLLSTQFMYFNKDYNVEIFELIEKTPIFENESIKKSKKKILFNLAQIDNKDFSRLEQRYREARNIKINRLYQVAEKEIDSIIGKLTDKIQAHEELVQELELENCSILDKGIHGLLNSA